MSDFTGNSESPEAVSSAFANGWTAFPTVEGLDIILRTAGGESKGRLSTLDATGNLVGSMFEPCDDPNVEARAITLVVTPTVTKDGEDVLHLSNGKQTWELRQPAGKSHWFAFMNQWPRKAEAASSLKAMLAGLKKKS